MIAMGERVSRKMAIYAANLLAQSGIPWERLRGRKSACSYQRPLSLTNVDGKDVWVLRVQRSAGQIGGAGYPPAVEPRERL
jgi:hypothetical protein